MFAFIASDTHRDKSFSKNLRVLISSLTEKSGFAATIFPATTAQATHLSQQHQYHFLY